MKMEKTMDHTRLNRYKVGASILFIVYTFRDVFNWLQHKLVTLSFIHFT